MSRSLRIALPLLLLAVTAAGQDPFGPADPFESRFKTKPTFQIKFRVPESGGEVRLTTKNPVHYEKDVYWEGSGEVTIEYQDVKITADRARYDFPTKTATLEGNVVIDQGPTRMSGTRAVFRVEEKTGKLELAVMNVHMLTIEWSGMTREEVEPFLDEGVIKKLSEVLLN